MERTTRFAVFLLVAFLAFAPAFHAGAQPVHAVFAGDTYFGENYAIPENFLDGTGNPGLYIKSARNLSKLLLSADWSVINLETPLTCQTDGLPAGKDYLHWADPEKTAAALLQCGVKSVGLANNHSFDFGIAGLRSTMEILGKRDIAFSGAGMNAAEAERPLEKTFPACENRFSLMVFTGFEYRKRYDKEFHFYAARDKAGVALLLPFRIASSIKETREDNPAAFIIIFPHWGSNYRWTSRRQRETARSMIDAGADIVIGHGAHMFQEIERYKDRWIIYGLGNFVFNSPGRYESEKEAHPYSFIADIIIETAGNCPFSELRLYPTLTDNSRTGYSSRFVSHEEFLEVLSLLEQNCRPWGLPNLVRTGVDSFGPYLRLPLKPMALTNH